MDERRKFEPKTPEKFQRLVESGEEIIIAGAGKEGNIKIADGNITHDEVYIWGEPAVQKREDCYGNPYGRAYMLVKDNTGLMYLLRHRIEYSNTKKAYSSVCRTFDIVSNEELELYEKLSLRHGWNVPNVEPIQIFSGTKEITEFGQLWLLSTHYTSVAHKLSRLSVPNNIKCPLESLEPDEYLDLFSTEKNAYGRGIGRSTMNIMEGIIARLQPHNPRIKFVGTMEPLDHDQRFKRKIGDASLEMIDEYGERHLNDAYCAIATVYKKLGFSVTPMTGLRTGRPKSYASSRATVLQKELNSDEIMQDPMKAVSKHFANPLDEEDVM